MLYVHVHVVVTWVQVNHAEICVFPYIVCFYSPSKVHCIYCTYMYDNLLGFSRLLAHGCSKKPSVQELRHEKANMLMSIRLTRLPMVSDISPTFSKTGPSLVLSQSNTR